MLASEMIKELQKIVKEYGDCEVYYHDETFVSEKSSVLEISFYRNMDLTSKFIKIV